MSKKAEHLQWCRWCNFEKSESSRIRHEDKEHSFEKEETKKMQDFQRSKSSQAPLGYIWCHACSVIVENTVSGVSNHSNSKYHRSKSGRPLKVVCTTVCAVSKTSVAADPPQLQVSRRQPEVQKKLPEDADDGFQYGGHQPSGTCPLLFFFVFTQVHSDIQPEKILF